MTDKQKKLHNIYFNIIEPVMNKHKITQENLCLDCYFSDIIDIDKKNKLEAKIDEYGLDTGICDSCGKTNELINEFLYYSVKELGFNIKKDMYGIIPRIYISEKE
jgi:hypothetical protein